VKITGIVLILLGLIAGAVVVVQMVNEPPADATPAGPRAERPNMTVPLAVCGAAVVVGGLLVMFGGRSYYVSNNPRVRN
jgi:hypothetical protein